MKDVFISYSRDDYGEARRVENLLTEEGWTVFIDVDIPTRARWDTHLLAELSEARCVVVLWSEFSICSPWVLKEAEIGLERGVLVQMLLSSVTLPEPFSAFQAVSRANWKDGTDPSCLARLIRAIRMICGGRKSMTIVPLKVFLVVGWSRYWPTLGPTINMECQVFNGLAAPLTLQQLNATAKKLDSETIYLSLHAPYRTEGTAQLARVEEDKSIEIPPGLSEMPIQLQGKLGRKRNPWQAGEYVVDLRGWTTHGPWDQPNVRTEFQMLVSNTAASRIKAL